MAARCELAIRRRDRLRLLDTIPSNLPVDEQDSQWIAGWDEQAMLGTDCHDAHNHRIRHARAVARTEVFAAVRAGRCRAGDAGLVKRLAGDPQLSDHPGIPRRKAEIDKLIETSERAQRFLAADAAGQSEAFLAEAEPALLIANATDFAPYRDRIAAWVDARLRRGDIIGPAAPPFLPVGTSSVVARWTWTQSRLVRICLVAADPAKFIKHPRTRGNAQVRPRDP